MKATCVFLAMFCIALAPQVRSIAQSLVEFQETATFKLFKDESQIGTISYSLDDKGDYQREFKLEIAGQVATYNMKMSPDESGNWKSGVIVTPTDTVEVINKDTTAMYSVKGKQYQTRLPDDYILDDNYGPVFESFVLKRYDMDVKGKQEFSKFIFPSTIMEVELEYMGREIREIRDTEFTFLRYDLTIAGINVRIWAGEDFKIYMMYVPMQYAAFVRDGFEDMLEYRSEDPLLSKPVFKITRESTAISMRDGVDLATDLYFPDTDRTGLATILIRTPYKKEMVELDANFFTRRGYVVAVQDCRGRFSSEGVWEPFMNEADDGYDTIEWLGTRPWSNGKVGMIGGSYVGWVQLWAASTKPPHLTTIIPNVAPPDPFYNIPYEYGAFFILGSLWWAEILETEATGDLSGKALSKINERKYEKILKTLPVIDLDKQVLGGENPYWRKWIENNVNNDYWKKSNFLTKLEQLSIPVFLQSGWFDGDGIGTKLNYMALKKSNNNNIKMIVGPWGHTGESTSRLGDRAFGQQAAIDLKTRYLKWFDYWLKGVPNDILDEPLVQVFVMSSNEWLTSDTYPLPETEFIRFYLNSQSGANTSNGDGMLATELSARGRDYDEYQYDPGDPTPFPEYYFKSEEEVEQEKSEAIDVQEQKKRIKAFHNMITEARNDILVYQTEPLLEPVSIAGPVSAVLHASSSAVDTDWFVTLMDVDENGDIFHLVKGVLRARFRNSMSDPQLLEKGRIYEYQIDLWHTGITFEREHRIRIEVSSALFPMFSRNLNTGGHNEMETDYVKATQRVYHSKEHPSYVLLPVIDMAKE